MYFGHPYTMYLDIFRKEKALSMVYAPDTVLVCQSHRVQFPLRLSNDFHWVRGERIKILERRKEASGQFDGYIVRNLDYMGIEPCFEKAWISDEVLNEHFIQ